MDDLNEIVGSIDRDFIQDKASETRKLIKAQNKLLQKARNKKEKQPIENEIKRLKDQWWGDVKHLF